MSKKIFDKNFLNLLQNINLSLRMNVSDSIGGERRSKHKGSSIEFSDFREYSPGDDFRRIDWNAYGRFEKLYIKLFMEERESLVNIFLDCSQSMEFGTCLKSDMMLRLTGIISYLTLNNLDRVCINAMYNDSIKILSPQRGKSSFNRLGAFLEELSFEGETQISSCITKKQLSQRGISIILSDFFVSKDIESAIKYLCYKKQEVFLFHILSNEEKNIDFTGGVRLKDSETGQMRDIYINPNVIRLYKKRFEEFILDLSRISKKYGAHYIKILSDENIEKIIFEKLQNTGLLK